MRVIQNATRLRISGGTLKGRYIQTVAVRGLRPTTDANRQALFNVLGDIVNDAKVLDLYAGTGSFGFEALSRGCAEAVFVEANGELCELLEKNSESLGVKDLVKIEEGKIEKLSDSFWNSADFNLVFADPPYEQFPLLCTDRIALLMNEDGIFVYEFSSRNKFQSDISGLDLIKTKVYGDTSFAFYRKKIEK
jgi:16S rRNA (guanine(966)-N(2))-methyltransferase RsmD